jgi:hypothetical protein
MALKTKYNAIKQAVSDCVLDKTYRDVEMWERLAVGRKLAATAEIEIP